MVHWCALQSSLSDCKVHHTHWQVKSIEDSAYGHLYFELKSFGNDTLKGKRKLIFFFGGHKFAQPELVY